MIPWEPIQPRNASASSPTSLSPVFASAPAASSISTTCSVFLNKTVIFFVIVTYLFISSTPPTCHCQPIHDVMMTAATVVDRDQVHNQQQQQQRQPLFQEGHEHANDGSFEYHHNNTNAVVHVIVTKSTSKTVSGRGTRSRNRTRSRTAVNDHPSSSSTFISASSPNEPDEDESISIAQAQIQDISKILPPSPALAEPTIAKYFSPTVPGPPAPAIVNPLTLQIDVTPSPPTTTTPTPTTYHPDFFFSPFHTLHTYPHPQNPRRKIENRSISKTHSGLLDNFHLRQHPDNIFSTFYQEFSQPGPTGRGVFSFHTQTRHRHPPKVNPTISSASDEKSQVNTAEKGTDASNQNVGPLDENRSRKSFQNYPDSIVIPTFPTVIEKARSKDDDEELGQIISVVTKTHSLTAASTAASLTAESKSISAASTVASSSAEVNPSPSILEVPSFRSRTRMPTPTFPHDTFHSPPVNSDNVQAGSVNTGTTTTTFHGHRARQIKRLKKSHASILPQNTGSRTFQFLSINQKSPELLQQNANMNSMQEETRTDSIPGAAHQNYPQQRPVLPPNPYHLFQTPTELPVIKSFNFNKPRSRPPSPGPNPNQASWEQPEQVWGQPEIDWTKKELNWGEPEKNWEEPEKNWEEHEQPQGDSPFVQWDSIQPTAEQRQPKMTPDEMFQFQSDSPLLPPTPEALKLTSDAESHSQPTTGPKIYEVSSNDKITSTPTGTKITQLPIASSSDRRLDKSADELEFFEDDFTDPPRFYEIGEDEEDEPTELNLDNNTMNSTIENAQLAARSWELPELSSSSTSLMSPAHHHRPALSTPPLTIAEMTAESIQVPQNIRNSLNNNGSRPYLSDIHIKISKDGQATMISPSDFESQRSLSQVRSTLSNTDDRESSSSSSTTSTSDKSESTVSTSTSERPAKRFGYVLDGSTIRKYRVEERTPDGYIVGEYGVINHDNGFLRGVRYTADGTINPRLIHQALMKFLSL